MSNIVVIELISKANWLSIKIPEYNGHFYTLGSHLKAIMILQQMI